MRPRSRGSKIALVLLLFFVSTRNVKKEKTMSKAKIFQIYYDDRSKCKLDDGFLALDNSFLKNDGWYEFSPIFNYFELNSIEDDVWYGFLSPKFKSKTGCDSTYVRQFLDHAPKKAEVAIFSPGWDQLSYFVNPWEQGEVWHPTIGQITEKFLVATQRNANLRDVVTDVTTSVFSNYFIAKKRFWMAWLEIAKDFKQFVTLNDEFNTLLVSYGSAQNQAHMKTFIQERLASYLLATGDYFTITSTRLLTRPVIHRLFPHGDADRKLFLLCDRLKRLYRKTHNKAYLDSFYLTRQQITFKRPY